MELPFSLKIFTRYILFSLLCTKFRLKMNKPSAEILILKKAEFCSHILYIYIYIYIYIEYDFYKSHRLYPQTAFSDRWC